MKTHASISAALAVWAGTVQAQLPPPPVSPAPVINYEYDAQGNLIRAIQAPGVPGFDFKTVNTYDSLSRVKDSTDPMLGKTKVAYDGLNQLLKLTDPRNLVTEYKRNGLNKVTEIKSPDTGTTDQTFDAEGNVKTRTDSRGVKANYTWDALTRLTKLVYSQSGQASQTYKWGYDEGPNGIGRLTSTSHPAGSTAYTYNLHGQVLTDAQTVKPATGSNTITRTLLVTYGYDAHGRVTSIKYPSGRKLHIGYTDGEVSSLGLARNDTEAPVPMLDQIQYQPFGGVQSWQWQFNTGPQANEKVYDLYGRLVRYRLGSLVRDITYDAAARIVSYNHYDATSGAPQTSWNQSFGYDANGRLTTVAANGSNWTIGYDANGNRAGVTLNGNARSYVTSASSNRLDSIGNPTRTFSYDSAGNTLADAGTDGYAATYDLAGRLNTLTKAGVTHTYSYNGFGQRTRKFSSTGSDSTVMYAYDLEGRILGEYDLGAKAIREYVWLGDTPVAAFRPDTSASDPPLIYFLYADHIDTPRIAVDRNNNLRWRWMAEPFGTTAAENRPSPPLGALTINLRFPGQLADAESGLYYNYFRSYDASVGRYSQSDPIGLEGGLNTYTYVYNNPLSYVDPTGELVWFAAPIIGAVGGGLIDLGIQLYRNGGNLKCVSVSEIVAAAAAGALFASMGPSGLLFGRAGASAARMGYQGGIFNTGNFRVGWSWHRGANNFSVHGGVPRTPSHWHKDLLRGPATPAIAEFGAGGAVVGGAAAGGVGTLVDDCECKSK